MKVKLNEIIDALDFTNDDTKYYYNPDTEKVLRFTTYFEKISEDECDELIEKSIMLPSKNDINEYQMMKDFSETISDKKLQNQLYISLNGSGAFKRFKDTCINYDIINDWYKFKCDRYKKIAIDWCKENNIKFE